MGFRDKDQILQHVLEHREQIEHCMASNMDTPDGLIEKLQIRDHGAYAKFKAAHTDERMLDDEKHDLLGFIHADLKSAKPSMNDFTTFAVGENELAPENKKTKLR